MGSVDGIFMNIAAVAGLQTKSFEEVRVDDYLKAYTTTGRPPAPVPETPTGDNERIALGLPILFKPVSTSSEPIFASLVTPPKARITNPVDLPPGQEFKELVAEERYQTLSCMPEYTGFALEELRYYAYLRGNVMSPIPITMHPFVQPPPSNATTTPSNPKFGDTSETGKDTLEHISTQAAYIEHSPEELRVAFLLSGRELNSAEIKQSQNPTPAAPLPPPPPPAPSTPGFGLGLGSPFPFTPTVPSFKF
ncbi:hypothetical protein K443DRAFT_685307 [Laccaria amethystina LaAM-08-1]|uniref:Uncharacterized protein n=1 Tax=Laccaria amethystina LaAM-08-1 TaxID=1095629 RepID=A0A0C9WI56_9AGAR|nr:hypothetical protein K443DRAFT_685307 [Laccaria amethystina LaAM-08-1]